MDRLGLILGGGGAKGAYQIGAWEALQQADMMKYVTDISGTSVGALNAVLIAQGDISLAKRIWNSIDKKNCITKEDVESVLMDVDSMIKVFRFLDDGYLKGDEIENIIDDNIEFDKIKNYHGKIFVTVTEGWLPDILDFYRTGKGEVSSEHFDITKTKNLNELKQWVMASAALPILYQKQKIKGKEYYDGGINVNEKNNINMNIPLTPLLNDGVKRFIVISCSYDEFIPRDYKIKSELYVEIKPSKDMGGLFDGTANFTHSNIARAMKLGYDDAQNVIKKYNYNGY